jgi:hypothetical protein
MSEQEYYKIRNYRCITIKYFGPTNHSGSRVQLSELDRNNKKQSFMVSYDYAISDIGTQAYKLLIERGFKVVCKVCLHDRDLILIDNWGNDWIDFKELKQ